MSLDEFIIVSEKLKFKDIILKYTIRDAIGGFLSIIPGTLGVIFRMGFYKIFLKKCGKGLRIGDFVKIRKPEKISIGDHVIINEFSLIDGDDPIEIGDYANIGSYVAIFTHEFNYKTPGIIKLNGKQMARVVIGKNTLIGTKSTILKGVTIGEGAVICAGSLVARDIPPYSIALGSPAKVIGRRK